MNKLPIDNLVTAYRASNEVYETAYNYYRFALPDYGELVIDFDKLSDAELIRCFRDKKDWDRKPIEFEEINWMIKK